MNSESYTVNSNTWELHALLQTHVWFGVEGLEFKSALSHGPCYVKLLQDLLYQIEEAGYSL